MLPSRSGCGRHFWMMPGSHLSISYQKGNCNSVVSD
jgi:hypothetical protein